MHLRHGRPGRLQFVGRTCRCGTPIGTTEAFDDGKPWLLRFFDQIRFYPVSSEELLECAQASSKARRRVEIEPGAFRLEDYHAFLADNADEHRRLQGAQQAAFDAERERWQASEAVPRAEAGDDARTEANGALPPGATAIERPVPGSVWKILVAPGHEVSAGETLVIVEAMKMEIAVCAPSDGKVAEVRCAEGRVVQLGQALVIMAEPPA